jgi:hypothetical protein
LILSQSERAPNTSCISISIGHSYNYLAKMNAEKELELITIERNRLGNMEFVK